MTENIQYRSEQTERASLFRGIGVNAAEYTPYFEGFVLVKYFKKGKYLT